MTTPLVSTADTPRGRPHALFFAAAITLLAGCDGAPIDAGHASPATGPATGSALGAVAGAERIEPVALAEGQRFGLSLRTLARRIAEAAERDETIPDDLLHLQGMGWIEGFVIDRAQQDLILIGQYSRTRPSLQLDDLVTGIRNVWAAAAGRETAPYCSLDPRPEDIRHLNRLEAAFSGGDETAIQAHFERLREAWGPQQTVIGGVPEHSRWARVCIDADYHMKAVSQSHVDLPGVIGIFQRSLDTFHSALESGASTPNAEGGMSRFWFHLAEGEPRFRESQDIVLLESCSVQLLTEAQVATADGQLRDAVGQDDADALAFAADFSAHLAAGSPEPRYQDLENLYRLLALLHAMQQREAAPVLGPAWDFYARGFQPARYALPAALPGLTNFRAIRVPRRQGAATAIIHFFPLVMGGGSFEMSVQARSFSRRGEGALRELRAATLRQRPGAESLFWAI